ncbi:unnamed protein product [Owenia fusiformis]|uniref:YitH/HolE acetyltransferase (GNAT) domain-containing protein n=1 Tax=Owenia fusiformis TaxID=6347 RepID=A0A8J1U7U6_OWEFU|nr:unnamed protein product [Owenia fusiformis]
MAGSVSRLSAIRRHILYRFIHSTSTSNEANCDRDSDTAFASSWNNEYKLRENVIIRTMKEEDIPVFAAWVVSLKWGYTESMVSAICKYDLKRCFTATSTNGKILGLYAGCVQTPEKAFASLCVVDSDVRGGCVLKALQINYTNSIGSQNVAYDVRKHLIETYKSFPGTALSFKRNCYEGFLTIPDDNDKSPGDVRVVPADEVHFDKLTEYDASIGQVYRPTFIKEYCFNNESYSIIAQKKANEICGFATMHFANVYNFIGPYYADDETTANALLNNLHSKADNKKKTQILCPDRNTSGCALIEKYGLSLVTYSQRMYNLFEPELPLKLVYGLPLGFGPL